MDMRDNFGETPEDMARKRQPPSLRVLRFLELVRNRQGCLW